ncbi:MAG: 4-oxalomesaconate tautomerase [Acetobacterales bacterium]
MQTRIPCVFMRGGTSRGPYFHASDLPDDVPTRDAVLLRAMGSPDVRQIDGIGGADPLTSKVAILSKSSRPGIDVDYLFAQVKVDSAVVDTSPNCGNIISGVGPFAVEEGLVEAQDGETTVRIFNVNTSVPTEAIVQTPGGQVTYDGDCAIDGVPGTAAPVKLNFLNGEGSKTGKLFPTGRMIDVIDGMEVTCLDYCMPIVFLDARSMGKTGYESWDDLDNDKAFFDRMLAMRMKAGEMMGFGDVTDSVVPKVVILAPPKNGGTVTARYFMPWKTHKAYAVTGSLCTGVCVALEGTVGYPLADLPDGNPKPMEIEHPTGRLGIEMDVSGDPMNPKISRAAVLRTCRRLFEGSVLIPPSIWSGKQPVRQAAE